MLCTICSQPLYILDPNQFAYTCINGHDKAATEVLTDV